MEMKKADPCFGEIETVGRCEQCNSRVTIKELITYNEGKKKLLFCSNQCLEKFWDGKIQ